MYSHRERERERGTVPSKSELDRKRISDVLDRSSPSTSKVINGGKDRSSVKSSSYTNTDSRSASNPISKNSNASDEESETDSEGSDISGSDGDDTSWITWFCNLRGNEFFCEVDDDYIQDDFNLCGLSSQVPYYDYALDLILDVESSHGDMFTEEQNELIESAAEMLYGLIHARFILTSKGMAAMLDKYKNYDFGRCPRVYCSGQTCLPVGQSDIARSSTVKIYCPRNIGVIACMCHCFAVYNCDLNLWWQLFCSLCFPIFLDSIIDIDGAYFGTTFPHLFLMTYGQLRPQKPSQNYVQRVFGFKLHKPQS